MIRSILKSFITGRLWFSTKNSESLQKIVFIKPYNSLPYSKFQYYKYERFLKLYILRKNLKKLISARVNEQKWKEIKQVAKSLNYSANELLNILLEEVVSSHNKGV